MTHKIKLILYYTVILTMFTACPSPTGGGGGGEGGGGGNPPNPQNYSWYWQTTNTTTSTEVVYNRGIATDSSGNTYITGYFQGSDVDFLPGIGTNLQSHTSNGTAFLTKISPSGATLWTRTWQGGETYGTTVTCHPNGEVVVGLLAKGNGTLDMDPGTGTTTYNTSGNSGQNNDLVLVWLDGNGTYLRHHYFDTTSGSGSYIFPVRVLVGSNNHIWVLLYFTGSNLRRNGNNLVGSHSGIKSVVLLELHGTNFADTTYQDWTMPAGASFEATGLALGANDTIYLSGIFQSTSNYDFDPSSGTANRSTPDSTEDGILLSFIWPPTSGLTSFNWALKLGSGNSGEKEQITDIILDNNGKLWAIGYVPGTVDFDPGVGNQPKADTNFLWQLDPSTPTFVRVESLPNYADAPSTPKPPRMLQKDSQGRLYVAGQWRQTAAVDFDWGTGVNEYTSKSTGTNASDTYLIQFNASGSYLRAWTWGASGTYSCGTAGVVASPDQSLSIALTFSNYNATYDLDPGSGTIDVTPGKQTGTDAGLTYSALVVRLGF